MLAALRHSFAHAPRTLRLVWRSSRGGTLVLGALTLFAALLPLAIAYVGKAIMDAVVAAESREAFRWVAVELAIVGAQAGVQRGLALVRSLLGARLSLDINVLILEKALALELRHFEDSEFYDRLTRARREASSRPVSVVNESFQLAQNLLTLAGYVVLLTRFSGLAVVGLVAAAVPATVAEMRFSMAAFRVRNWRSPDSRRLSYLEYVLANDSHAKEVKLFGLGPLFLGRYRRMGEEFYREDRTLAVRRAGWAYGLSLTGTAAFYACYAVMAVAAAAGQLTLGNMTLYVVAFRQGQQAFQSCLTAVGGMYEDNLYMSNLFEYLAIPTAQPGPAIAPSPARGEGIPADGVGCSSARSQLREERAVEGGSRGSPERGGTGTSPPERLGEGIRFDDVGFRYPGQERWVLRGISLEVPPGQSLALVGHNGAGKTTFIKLLARLYEPTCGRILLDGHDLREWSPDALRARIGVVFQDFNQYQLTVSENVAVGSVDHFDDRARILAAVERGGAAELVAGLADGLDTSLGRWFKDGIELSGGQWQKLALARAFMREEADILVLDEPTAALDAEAEHAVFARFRELTHGRTTILISHRFSTVRMADRIVVLEGGKVIEEGTHDELVAAGARYAHLFALQAQGYL